jgi:hypothetical protein
MTPEEIWRGKSEEELVAASNHLGEYTESGQCVIVAELQRRRESGLLSDTYAGDVRSDVDDSSSTSDGVDEAPQGLLGRLWRGDVPLRITYWVYGVLTNFVWLVFIAFATAANSPSLLLLLVALSLTYYVFIVVAIWRSAGRYAGNRIWGDLARATLALGLIRTVANLFVRT